MSESFDRLLAEARKELGTAEAREVDWEKVDAALFARLERERREERARFAHRNRPGMTLPMVALAAVASIVAVVSGKSREALDGDRASPVESAGTIAAIDGNGPVLIDGIRVASGAALKLGDVVETRSSRVTIERAGKVTMTLEPASRTVLTHVRGALIVALEQGAVEAQVTPVAAGEAFAVDVGSARVAVHGTHLRVARDGDRVVIDLNDGVISVGEAPRVGSLFGALVNAPAHVEFMATDALGTLTQTHDPGAVRGAQVRSGTFATPKAPPRKSDPGPGSRGSAPALSEAHPETRSLPGAPAKQTSPVEPTPIGTIANAVRVCMAGRPAADNVTVVVSTTLHLELADDGSVRTARFDPPVAPDVNACAAQSIYKQRFDRGGVIAIPIDFTN
jgi:hypothetical protein